MNQKIWSSLTVTLLSTALSTAISPAQQAKAVEGGDSGNPSALEVQQFPAGGTQISAQPLVQPPEVVKVGEFQSQIAKAVTDEEAIAKIHAYELEGRQAATIYVRSIPVLTFLGSHGTSPNTTKMGETAIGNSSISQLEFQKRTNPHQGMSNNGAMANAVAQTAQPSGALATNGRNNDPVWQATALATRLNQLSREEVNGEAIAVRWNGDCKCYSITINNEELVRVNENTILPDTTRNLEADALQATNRLRRLMGNAPPLQAVTGKPQTPPVTQVAVGQIRTQISGIASWYGPGFHGNRSASGERYNQNALTAAHRSLPFGTKVQVTNLNNGRSVVVKINDRGPYIRGRVIDVSAAAARALGMMQSGVAPVRIDVLANTGETSN
ncbi:septal ring lytic transglycosylase RlpA family protein [Limnofasciculus baicalensis]|uniref:Probable endolytic peptidoglycan transglycosylase RlpA n=1 Tax=Limnofasciculus baicalensis BBK-W-15 TaxID=2699891 RepID=A0AAE3GY17_9CYAN|nr:septal ring lytic transglycosylase RlpA family protein [Limnofasciculus baicalensis]MCP2731943.1 septal ring lytic transglycosylase RlpA family protein [Limnofasciculus baicalensis BBK-W-15]